jgi:hypothetical protein
MSIKPNEPDVVEGCANRGRASAQTLELREFGHLVIGISRLHASLYRLTGVQSPGWLDEPDGLSSTGFVRNAQRTPHKPSSLDNLITLDSLNGRRYY